MCPVPPYRVSGVSRASVVFGVSGVAGVLVASSLSAVSRVFEASVPSGVRGVSGVCGVYEMSGVWSRGAWCTCSFSQVWTSTLTHHVRNQAMLEGGAQRSIHTASV